MINNILGRIDEDNLIQHILDDLDDEDDELPSNQNMSLNSEDYIDLKETDLDLVRKLTLVTPTFENCRTKFRSLS